MSSEDRIANLSRRFQDHATGRKPPGTRTRERRSFYLDGTLAERLDRQYRELEHELYPRSLSKSEFLEALFEYSLEHLDEIKSDLKEGS